MALPRRLLLAALLPPGAAAAPDARLEVAGAFAPPVPRRLGLQDLDALGVAELVTRTPWTRGPQRFGGLALARLLAALEARGETLHVLALNDHAASMPVAAALADGAFLATRRDGRRLAVREGGPFWIVFPWSRRPELDTAVHRQRSVWQVRRLELA
jgi:hypothetical protein